MQSRLTGKRVLVTRPVHQSKALADALRAEGAQPIVFPVIEIVPLGPDRIRSLLKDAGEYDWAIFTSVNTVETVMSAVEGLPAVRIAAIGSPTARALAARGIEVDLVPDEFVAEAVVAALVERGVEGKRILLPRADIARDTLPDGLRAAGATVEVVPVYSTQMPAQVDRAILDSITRGQIDIITFTSPSTVRNLMTLVGGALPSGSWIACIGPVTARAAQEAGLSVDIVASEYTVSGLVSALVESEDHE